MQLLFLKCLFLHLFKEGKVYRAYEPTLWDVVDQTALAQTDIEDIEKEGVMNEIQFHTSLGEKIIIASTRPELLPACVAIFFNPEDKRYKHLIEKKAITPLFLNEVPIIADPLVDIEKGSGLVMCCTFGDSTDIEWWKKYKLPLKTILNKYGRIELDSDTPMYFELNNKKISDAREIILKALRDNGNLISHVSVKRMVKCAERSKTPIEILVSPQWFIRIIDEKLTLLEKSRECNWFPKFMQHRIENWINGLKWDWCISRQRFFGVPFPVWYSKRKGEEGKIIVADKNVLPIDPSIDLPEGYLREEVEADLDVMDTWATSSVTPQINSHAINEKFAINLDRHKKLFPADLRPQSHEIIRTWAFCTIVKSMFHENLIPWGNLMISGWVLAADKSKMSKSKGNIVTPFELIQDKGADVIRYWASTSKLGIDVAYSEDMFKIGKKFINKLWNASKFVSLQIADLNVDEINIRNIVNIIDKWILMRLNSVIKKSTEAFEKLEYCDARCIIENFFWNDFCDNYLEIIKVRVYDQEGINELGQKSAKNALYILLENLLRLLMPFIPHVSEELYDLIYITKVRSKIFKWPEILSCDLIEEKIGEDLIMIIEFVRQYKSEKQLSIKSELNKFIIMSKYKDKSYFSDSLEDLKNVINAKQIIFEVNKAQEEEFKIKIL